MSSSTPRLRNDLRPVAMPGKRTILVIDEIAGRFSRIPLHLWTRLASGVEASESNWRDAYHAGLVRQRVSGRNADRQSVLSLKIPLVSLDRAAAFLEPAFRLLFAPTAIAFWIFAIAFAALTILVRWGTWVGSASAFRDHLSSLSVIQLVGLFIVTKTLHEIGHAVACYRMGSRVGKLGVWFLCFFPCPYVDVTDVWRQTSRLRRAAVMAAGVWVELALACLAAWCWILSNNPDTQLTAMNVVLVCSVSTLAFNANPLMRFDGYYVLSDFLDSADLRREASLAFRKFVRKNQSTRHASTSARERCLAIYHVASRCYQVLILAVIAFMLLAWADQLGLFRIACVLIVAYSVRRVCRWLRIAWNVNKDPDSPYQHSRITITKLVFAAVVVTTLAIPLPRYSHFRATLIAADDHPIYFPPQGTIADVRAVIGQPVDAEDVLATVNAPQVLLDHLDAQQRVASLKQEINQAQLAALRPNSEPNHLALERWKTIEEALDAAKESEAHFQETRNRLKIKSPVRGIVLAGVPLAGSARTDIAQGNQAIANFTNSVAYPRRLQPESGQAVDQSKAWCRIATSTRLEAQWDIPVELRDRIIPGRVVRLHTDISNAVLPALVERISASQSVNATAMSTSLKPYRAVASIETSPELPDTLKDMAIWDGSRCDAVVHLPWRSLLQDALDLVSNKGWSR